MRPGRCVQKWVPDKLLTLSVYLLIKTNYCDSMNKGPPIWKSGKNSRAERAKRITTILGAWPRGAHENEYEYNKSSSTVMHFSCYFFKKLTWMLPSMTFPIFCTPFKRWYLDPRSWGCAAPKYERHISSNTKRRSHVSIILTVSVSSHLFLLLHFKSHCCAEHIFPLFADCGPQKLRARMLLQHFLHFS